MTEPIFEQRLADMLRTHADEGVRPIDPYAIASATIETGRASLRVRWQLAFPGRGRLPILVATLVLALAATAVVIGGRLLQPRQLVTVPEPSPTAPAIASTESNAAAPAVLVRPWIADQPTGFGFAGESGPRRWSLLFTPDGAAASVRVSAVPRLRASVAALDPTTVRFTTTAPGGAVTRDGTALPDCVVGDVGDYHWSVSADGFTLTLTPVADACPARVAVLGRTWAQSLGGDSLGDRGVVDAFEPEFAVTLPHGAFASIRTSDAIEIWAADESVGLLAWKDPQGFVDPCDSSGARFDIAPGAAAFVAYLRQLAGITVLSAAPLTIDGSPATLIETEARPEGLCPRGWVEVYQPKAETTDRAWHVEPGVRDSLYVIDRPDATVMIEVLPIDAGSASSIISSVSFLDEVPPVP